VQAELGIERLRNEVDTLIVIPNDRLLSISDRHVSVLDAFKAADQVLLSGVQGITDLITTPGLINLDFADVKSVMSGAGSALMGTGSSRGDDRAVAAAEMAISSPLLEASIDGAHGVLLSIQGGSDLGLFEINEAAQLVANSAAVDANIIFGAVIDDALGDEVRVTVIAAGLDENRSGRSGSGDNGTGYASHSSSRPTGSTFAISQPSPAAQRPYPAADGYRANGTAPFPELPRTNGGDEGDGIDGTRENQEFRQADGYDEADLPPAPAPLAALLGAPVSVDEPGSGTDTAARASLPDPPAAPTAPKTFDVASTRRRPVVFEEDDDLDVPDFLK
jgi:cell division protein FtsZ